MNGHPSKDSSSSETSVIAQPSCTPGFQSENVYLAHAKIFGNLFLRKPYTASCLNPLFIEARVNLVAQLFRSKSPIASSSILVKAASTGFDATVMA